MRKTNYILFRYDLQDDDDQIVGGGEHAAIFESVRGKPTGYRETGNDVTPKNVLMRLRLDNIQDEFVCTFDVGYRITERTENRWNNSSDDYDLVPGPADDTIFTRFVAAPRIGILAVKDGSGDRLSAQSGMGRLKKIVAAHSECQLTYQKTATPEDIDAALQHLRLTEFSFDVRPFNPHPSSPGEQLDALMKAAGVGRLKASARPSPIKPMTATEDGVLAEAIGLSRAGYGQYSLKGETQSGSTLAYGRPAFNHDRDKNQAAAEKPRMLKVAVPIDDTEMTEQEHVVAVMRELFGGHRQTA